LRKYNKILDVAFTVWKISIIKSNTLIFSVVEGCLSM
jgi:hypothetical protein